MVVITVRSEGTDYRREDGSEGLPRRRNLLRRGPGWFNFPASERPSKRMFLRGPPYRKGWPPFSLGCHGAAALSLRAAARSAECLNVSARCTRRRVPARMAALRPTMV